MATSASCSTSFGSLRDEGRVVFVCLHPNEPFHIELMREVCERFFFVRKGRLSQAATLAEMAANEAFRDYLGHLAPLV